MGHPIPSFPCCNLAFSCTCFSCTPPSQLWMSSHFLTNLMWIVAHNHNAWAPSSSRSLMKTPWQPRESLSKVPSAQNESTDHASLSTSTTGFGANKKEGGRLVIAKKSRERKTRSKRLLRSFVVTSRKSSTVLSWLRCKEFDLRNATCSSRLRRRKTT